MCWVTVRKKSKTFQAVERKLYNSGCLCLRELPTSYLYITWNKAALWYNKQKECLRLRRWCEWNVKEKSHSGTENRSEQMSALQMYHLVNSGSFFFCHRLTFSVSDGITKSISQPPITILRLPFRDTYNLSLQNILSVHLALFISLSCFIYLSVVSLTSLDLSPDAFVLTNFIRYLLSVGPVIVFIFLVVCVCVCWVCLDSWGEQGVRISTKERIWSSCFFTSPCQPSLLDDL